MANVKFVKGKPLGKTWKKVIEEQLMKHGARLARVELTAGRQRDAERVTVRVKKIVENVILLKNPMNASTMLSMNGKSPMISTAPPFVLMLSKDERRVFQQNQSVL